jgi:hypothetical protein
MILCDENFIKTRSCFGRRDEFYNALRIFFWGLSSQTGMTFCCLLSLMPGAAKSKIAVINETVPKLQFLERLLTPGENTEIKWSWYFSREIETPKHKILMIS